MFGDNWHKLVELYAAGRKICNCRCAYFSDGPCYKFDILTGEVVPSECDVCENGCSANQIRTREEIATQILAEVDRRSSINPFPANQYQ